MKHVGQIIALIILTLMLGGVMWCAIPDAGAFSPHAPDANPDDNYAEVCCPNDCLLVYNETRDPRYDFDDYDLMCKIEKKDCKTIKGKADETCWCQCAEDEFGFASPICICHNFFDDDLNGPWDDDV